MSLVCINVTQFFFSCVVFFPAVFSAGQQTCLVAWTTSTPLDRFAIRLKKWLAKKLQDRTNFLLHLCKLEICMYISLAAIYGLTAITKILVAGWKHASFLCYSMGARWFLCFLGPKLELPSMSAYSLYLGRLWVLLTYYACSIMLPVSKRMLRFAMFWNLTVSSARYACSSHSPFSLHIKDKKSHCRYTLVMVQVRA